MNYPKRFKPSRLLTTSLLFTFLVCVFIPKLTAQAAPAEAQTPADKDAPVVTLDAFVITGSMTPRTVLESPLSITTVDTNKIEQIAPRSTTEMLKVVPGLFTESSGGEGLENVLVRGIELSGAFTYLVLQEDGLPVTSESTMRYATADQFTRMSSMVGNVDALRGGSANIFATNASQGVVNFISREGGSILQGETAFNTSSYGTLKNEDWLSGPLGENSTFAIGGWYRVDNGPRNPGYSFGNRGGQLMGNVKYTFKNGKGFIKFSAKVLDDYNIFDVPMPLQNANSPQSIPFGPSIKDGSTADSADNRRIFIPNSPVGPVDYDAANGVHSRVGYAGAELNYDITSSLKFTDMFRYTSIYREINYYLNNAATPWQTLANGSASKDKTQFAAALETSGNYDFELSYPGQAGTVFAANPAAAASYLNGYGMTKTFDHAGGSITDFQEDMRLTQSFNDDKTHVTAGVYMSDLNNSLSKQFNQVLTDVTPDYHRVDITFLNASTGKVIGLGTYNGIYQAGSTFTDDTSEEREVSPYVEVETKLGHFTLDAGVRHQIIREDATIELTQAVNANTAATGTNAALENFQTGNGNYVQDPLSFNQNAWTAGANYTFSPHFSVFGRYSYDDRFISLTDLTENYHSGRVGAAGNPTNYIKQGELGIKTGGTKWAVFLTAFDIDLTNIFQNQVVTNPITQAQTNQASFQNNLSQGLELDALWSPVKGLSFELSGVWDKSRLTDYNTEKQTLLNGSTVLINDHGLVPARTPESYGTLTAAYRLPRFSFGTLQFHASAQYTGKQFSDLANSEPDPLKPWTEFVLGGSFTTRNGYTLRVDINNLFDSNALTEGDPRTGNAITDPSAKSYNARPILPRTIQATLAYKF